MTSMVRISLDKKEQAGQGRLGCPSKGDVWGRQTLGPQKSGSEETLPILDPALEPLPRAVMTAV